jgi:hypothetical protein
VPKVLHRIADYAQRLSEAKPRLYLRIIAEIPLMNRRALDSTCLEAVRRARDRIELGARDAVLAEKEAQLGCMLLDVTHRVEEQLQIADRLAV